MTQTKICFYQRINLKTETQPAYVQPKNCLTDRHIEKDTNALQDKFNLKLTRHRGPVV